MGASVERDPATGEWSLVIPSSEVTYDAAHGVRVKHRLDVPRGATYEEAVEAAREELERGW